MTQTKTINAGPVGMKPKGAYNAATTYTLLDTVLYNHDSWVCKAMNQDGSAAEITGQAPADGSQYWQALTDGGRAAVADGTQVRTDFDAWFGATPSTPSGIRAIVSNWLASVQDAWTAWFSDSVATGVRYIWNHWFGVDETTEGSVQKQWADLSADATAATTAATIAATKAENLNDHPAYIADGTSQKPGDEDYWYIWDYATQQYVKSERAKGDDLDYSTMTHEEYQLLVEDVKNSVLFASTTTCEDVIDELQ